MIMGPFPDMPSKLLTTVSPVTISEVLIEDPMYTTRHSVNIIEQLQLTEVQSSDTYSSTVKFVTDYAERH